MKNVCYFILLLCVSAACKNPLEDFSLTFKEPVADGRLQFTVRDFTGKIPAGLELKVEGPDAGLLVNSLNDPTYAFNEEGQLLLAVERSVSPVSESPLRFNIQISALGYTTRTFNIQFSSRANQQYYVRLAELGNGQVQGFQIQNAAGESLLKTASGSQALMVQWPADQKWSTVSGSPAQGGVQLNLIYYGQQGKSFLPGGGRVTRPLLPDGSLAPFPFDIPQVDGMVEIEAHDEAGNLATDFNRPIPTRLYLPQSLPGEKKELLSYSVEKGKWIKEGEVTVHQDNSGAAYVAFEMTHFSFWMATSIREICPAGPLFKVSSDFSDLDLSYYFEVLNGEERLRTGYMNVNTGAGLSLSYLPVEAKEARLKIFNYSDYQGGNREEVLYESAAVPVCEASEYPVNLKGKMNPVPIKVTFEAACPAGKSLDESKLPSQMLTQISAPGQNQWRNLLTFTRDTRLITTYRLVKGQTYDFRISTDGGNSWPFLQSNYTVNKNEWTIKVDTEGYCK